VNSPYVVGGDSEYVMGVQLSRALREEEVAEIVADTGCKATYIRPCEHASIRCMCHTIRT
jgi:hypothetical protein